MLDQQFRKIPTHIQGLDEALGGGIPRGHVVLVTGLPGTMKSSLVFAILTGCARHEGLKSLYVSLEQTEQSLRNQMLAMGCSSSEDDLVDLLDLSKFQLELGRGAHKVWVDFLKNAMKTQRETRGVGLVALDSLEAFEVLASFKDRRTELFRLFEWLRGLEVTTLIITESPPESRIPALGYRTERNDEDYLSDGIIQLRMHQVSDLEVQRRIRIVKMRGTRHRTGDFALVFEGGSFSVVKPMSA